MLTAFDFGAFIVSLIMTGSTLIKYKKIDTLFLLLEIAVTFNCLGRYMLSVSQTLDTAIWANRVLYVGGVFTAPLLVIVLFKICNIKLPRVIIAVMTLYSTVVLCLVMTIGYSGIYYKDVSLVVQDGYSYLEKVYGPLHVLYPTMLVLYGVFLVVFLICALRMRNKLSYRIAIGASVMGFAIMASYLVERLLDTNASVISISYLIAMLFTISYFDRLYMYDMSANVISSIEERKEYGYIVFDRKFRYISSDSYAKEIFPEIDQWVVDAKAPLSGSQLYTEVVQFLLDMKWENGEKKVISVSDKIFEVEIRPITHGSRKAGYLIELTDRTIERKYYNSIKNYNAQLESEVAAKTANIMRIKDMMVLGMADMVESRDNNTGGHIKRTSAIVRVFSEKLKEYRAQLGISEDFLKLVEKAAPMHDLGKIAIDDSILRKPGRFNDDEYCEMKRHTVEGAKIVKNILQDVEDDEFVRIAENVALYHHERWNGKGYPMGVSGSEIPIEARIMALADVFDALVSERCYKQPFTYNEAFAIIEEDLGEHFDPQLGAIFLQCRRELEIVSRSL